MMFWSTMRKKYFVGKAVGKNPAKTTVVKRVAFGIGLQAQQGFGVVS